MDLKLDVSEVSLREVDRLEPQADRPVPPETPHAPRLKRLAIGLGVAVDRFPIFFDTALVGLLERRHHGCSRRILERRSRDTEGIP